MILGEEIHIPCLKQADVVEKFRERFVMHLTEEECNEYVNELVRESLGNWRTRQYDKYQYLTNGYYY